MFKKLMSIKIFNNYYNLDYTSQLIIFVISLWWMLTTALIIIITTGILKEASSLTIYTKIGASIIVLFPTTLCITLKYLMAHSTLYKDE